MKKITLLVFVAVTLLSSCAKEKGCVPTDPSSEKSAMVAFCTANNITYTEHPSGILYQITDAGAGVNPSVSSKVFMAYTGKYLNGTTFETQINPSATGWPLGSLIDGWKIGVPLIKKGGKIKLIIPSSLAYSCTGSGSIAPNTPLFFDIWLTEVL